MQQQHKQLEPPPLLTALYSTELGIRCVPAHANPPFTAIPMQALLHGIAVADWGAQAPGRAPSAAQPDIPTVTTLPSEFSPLLIGSLGLRQ